MPPTDRAGWGSSTGRDSGAALTELALDCKEQMLDFRPDTGLYSLRFGPVASQLQVARFARALGNEPADIPVAVLRSLMDARVTRFVIYVRFIPMSRA